jgi:multiple sugar transport system ATP-binding protein
MSLTIKNLSKQFDTILVLKNINLEIQQGEFLVLLGPSGCGKSTLLNCVAGLEAIEDEGSILINAQEVTDKAPKDRNIAMVFQSYALYPTMTVRKNITFGLQCRRTPKVQIEQTLRKTVELLQISDLLERKPAALSGGQRQRVAIARALVHEPDVFLLDEPMSNLDAKLRAEMRVELKNLHRRLNATIVFVTHDQVEAMTLATKIAVLNQGVMQQVGSPDEVYHTPENRFVAEFIGTPRMNLISGKLAQSEGKVWVQSNGLRFPAGHYSFREPPNEGRPVVLGVRPENVHATLGDREERTTLGVDVRVSNVENMGADLSVFCEYQDTQLIGRFLKISEKPSYGEQIRVWMDCAGCSIFCQSTGERL